ncbi:hypothetical protein ACWA7J_09020 [Leptothrix sp. BB-4]
MSMHKQYPGALTRRQMSRWMVASPLVALFGAAPAQAMEAPRGRVLLSVSGAISRGNAGDGARRFEFDADMLDALPTRVIRTRTPWHKGVVSFSGPALSEVLTRAGASGQMLQMTALNDYQVRMPAGEVLVHDPILARRADGSVLSVRDKGPLFLIFPFDEDERTRNDTFYARSIWQLKAIEVR